MLIIATDGEPWGGPELFVDILRRITNELPVNIVIRLCTDDQDVVEYYDKIDEEVELPLDIIDDLHCEAQGVNKLNPWLSYSYVLHMVREAGTLSKVFDWIDERPLTPLEVSLVTHLFLWKEGCTRYPHQPDAFLAAAERDLPGAQMVFDGLSGTWELPIKLAKLQMAVHPSKYSFLGQTLFGIGLGAVAAWYYTGKRPCSGASHQPLATIFVNYSGAFDSSDSVPHKRTSEQRRLALRPAVAALPLPVGIVAPDAPIAPVDLSLPRLESLE
jgi:hypothetical protein